MGKEIGGYYSRIIFSSGHKKSPSESGRSTAPRYHPNSGNKNIAGSQRTYNGAAGIGYRRHRRFDLSCYEAKRLHARTTAFSRGGLSVERLCVKANFITAFINFSISHLPSVFKSFRKKSFKIRKFFSTRKCGRRTQARLPRFCQKTKDILI